MESLIYGKERRSSSGAYSVVLRYCCFTSVPAEGDPGISQLSACMLERGRMFVRKQELAS